MNAPHADFRPHYEPRDLADPDALRLEIERLRDFVETRALTQERLMRAMLAEAQTRLAEALEPRIQLATGEAVAYAHHHIARQEATLRALGRRFAEFAREAALVSTSEPPACGVAAYALGVADADAPDARVLALGEADAAAYLRDAASLPIAPGGASRLTAAHVIEHIDPEALATRVLPHWRSRLAPGGELVLTTLDGPAVLAQLAQGGDFAAARARLFEGGARALRNLVDAAQLVALLTDAGFSCDAPTRAGPTLRIVARA